MTAAIEVRQLTRRFAGKVAVDAVTFTVAPGEVVGFLGPNGAGKSTTLRMMTGYLGATAGTVSIVGHDLRDAPMQAKRAFGYLPEGVPLYGEMRVAEYLRHRADLKGVPWRQCASAAMRALEQVHATDAARIPIAHLSKGYRQRIGLADALVAEPPVLILDEPTSGMDPNQIRQVRALIRSLAGRHAVLLSTHILPEVEASCDRVVVIHRGKLVAEGSPAELGALRQGAALELRLRGPQPLVWQVLDDEGFRAELLHTEGSTLVVRAVAQERGPNLAACTERLLAALIGQQIAVSEVRPLRATLEEAFAELTVDAVDMRPSTEGTQGATS